MVQGVEVLAVVQVPQHGAGVLAAAGAQAAVGGHGHRVQVASVADVVGLQLAVRQVPDLKEDKIDKLEAFIEKTLPASCVRRDNKTRLTQASPDQSCF